MKTIIDTATEASKFSTLIAALKAASLTDTLRGKGPFTVFAPTDEAFKKLPQGQLDRLLKDPTRLKTLLTYHVIPGAVHARDVKPGEVKTVEGSFLTAAVKDGKLAVNGARVVQADIAASNGVIHAIDTVIMPKTMKLAQVA
jgi:uncharacterized surface protein with fasciclin (FAS1) repeats